MLLLFGGVSMQAQSVASEQMDEQFSDGSELPYGWFGEGWKMAKVDDDGVVQSEATENKGFDFGSMGMNPGQNPGQTPSMDPTQQDGGFGMDGMFGGPRYMTYLLTPPVNVKSSEELVIRARKTQTEGGFSFDMKAIMGMTDTIVVVERSVYGKNQWLRVADLTSTLSDDFQDFTITGTPEGVYRFRIKSYVNADVTSVKGFHIDSEAPDLLVTRHWAPIRQPLSSHRPTVRSPHRWSIWPPIPPMRMLGPKTSSPSSRSRRARSARCPRRGRPLAGKCCKAVAWT